MLKTRMMAADGTPRAAVSELGEAGPFSEPSLVWNGSQFATAEYMSSSPLALVRLDANGKLLGRTALGDYSTYTSALTPTWGQDEWVLGHSEKLIRVSTAGDLLAEYTVTPGGFTVPMKPSISYSGKRFGVFYATPNTFQGFFRTFDAAGLPGADQAQEVDTVAGISTTVSGSLVLWDGATFVGVWVNQNNALKMIKFAEEGGFSGSPVVRLATGVDRFADLSGVWNETRKEIALLYSGSSQLHWLRLKADGRGTMTAR